ncbi:hypothetical protein ACA910_000325 [Epithemia clementina (nom. ined.)]
MRGSRQHVYPFGRCLSVSVWVRTLRRLSPGILFLSYLCYRLSPLSRQRQDTTTLMADLVELLTNLRQALYQRLVAVESSDGNRFVRTWLWGFIDQLSRLCEDVMAIMAVVAFARLIYVLYHYSINDWKYLLVTRSFQWAQNNLYFVRDALNKQADDMSSRTEEILHKKPNRTLVTTLPIKGRDASEILQELRVHATEEDKRWSSGRISGTVYPDSPEHTQLMNQVYGIYSWSNPLHPGVWPKLNQCEGEVISMACNLMHAPMTKQQKAPAGCITSGGTESILLAIRAHFVYYGKERGIVHPELICGSTAHAAVDKACEIYGIRKVMIDCDDNQTYQLDPVQVKRHITSNTIMIYASAPSYPQGVVDPIPQLSDLALQYDIGFHVDACLGGFILPFCGDSPVFDFRNPGVTSMSADSHKFGYASKGTSIVMYRSKELRHAQYFCYVHWAGGMYSTPTFAGSRPGALSACAWAAMVSIGEEGYRTRAQSIVKAARDIAKGVASIPGLNLMTPQQFMVVCFGSSEMDIYRVQDMMSKQGWTLNSMQFPAGIHICVTLNVVPQVSQFLKDLRLAVEQVRKEGSSGRQKGTAGIYGTVGAVPAGAVEPTLKAFTDMTLTP